MDSDLIIGASVLILGEIALLAFAIWCWRGRTPKARWWVSWHMGDGCALVVLPGFALLGLAAVVAVFVPPEARWLVMVAPVAVAVWGALVALVSPFWWPAQKLWGPRWYVNLSKEEVQNYEFNGELSAAMRQLGQGPVEDRGPLWLGSLVKSFWANRLLDGTKPSRRNVARGAIHVFENGVWFEPSGAPAQIRADCDAAFRWAGIEEVQVASDRSDVRGVDVSGLLDRSFLTRLILRTETGDLLFEVTSWKARRAAECIQQEQARNS